jgi:molecular chaperone GrpE (heat shock protein)
MMQNIGEETEEEGDVRAGMKRKRTSTQQDDSADIRQEMARLRTENEELKKQHLNMMAEIRQLQNIIGPGFQHQQQQHGPPRQAPQATMM